MQAAHDFLAHRTNLAAYDHHDFPGVVARTFIGPLVLALLSWPATLLVGLNVRFCFLCVLID
jgi:alpha-1,6-mannosyltransferase